MSFAITVVKSKVDGQYRAWARLPPTWLDMMSEEEFEQRKKYGIPIMYVNTCVAVASRAKAAHNAAEKILSSKGGETHS